MKIGIISDTHGDLSNAERAINDMGKVDLLIHAGDTYEDAMKLKEKFSLNVIAICGNTDCSTEKPSEQNFMIEDKKIFLTHGHKYDVKDSLNNLYFRAKELEADIVIFGHSHVPQYIRENNLIFINPGSVSRPRGGSSASYALLEINEDHDGNLDIKLITLV